MVTDFETIAKLFIAVTGFITVLLKLTDSFSETRKKRNLKADLELLEKINRESLDKTDKEKISNQTKTILDEYLSIKETTFKWFDIFYALILFVGFGWWTIYLYELSLGFNPWTILTGLISFIGLGLLIDGKWTKRKEEKVLITIVLYKGISISIVLFGTSTFAGLYLFNVSKSYNNWYLLIGVIFILALKSFCKLP